MITRLITGIGVVAVTVGAFFLRSINADYFSLFLMILAVLGTIEMVRALKETSTAQKILTCVLPVFIFECAIFLSWKFSFYAIISYIFVMFALLVIDNKHSTLEGLKSALLCAIYPTAFLIPALLANYLEENAKVACILIFLIAPCADTIAYCVGCTVKGKKLCPSISPKKTISGAIGGLIGGILGSVILYFIMKDSIYYTLTMPGWLWFALIGLVGSILTEFGDLVESVIKRQLKIKDLGNLLPGHGGIMDRIDGLMFLAPFIYAVFYFMV